MQKKINCYLFSSILCLSSFLYNTQAFASLPSLEQEDQLIVKNRILAKVGDRTISVLDVMKKMEVFLYRYYPQYVDSPQMRYQYFSSQWKDTLMQMIDHELILLDAEKMELKILDAEVRETLLDRFGPNVMSSLDKLGLSYEEAKTMIHAEIVVQKMTWFKAQAKAVSSVNTQDVKSAYSTYCKQNPPKENWEYQVLSIKAASEDLAHQVAQKVFELCKDSPSRLESMAKELEEPIQDPEASPTFQISLSNPIVAEDKNLSTAYKEILPLIPLHSISTPILQANKGNGTTVYKIFYLKNHTKTTVPTLRSLYEKLRTELIQGHADKEFGTYVTKLRNYYGFDAKHLEEAIPSNFQPFSLQ